MFYIFRKTKFSITLFSSIIVVRTVFLCNFVLAQTQINNVNIQRQGTSESSHLARLITVKLFGSDSESKIQGSGVLVARSLENTGRIHEYLLLTNEHVVKGNDIDIYVQTHDNATYRSRLHPLNDKIFANKEDLKLLYFYSTNEYKVPQISNIEKVKPNDQVLVGGYPCTDTCDIELRMFKPYQGNVELTRKPLMRGYNLSYKGVSAEKGSSGGPVIWQNSLIGINGRGVGINLISNEQYDYADGTKGMSSEELSKLKNSSLGISVDAFKRELETNNKELFDLPKIDKNVQYLFFPTTQHPTSVSSEGVLNKTKEYTNIYFVLASLVIFVVMGCLYYLFAKYKSKKSVPKVRSVNSVHQKLQENSDKMEELVNSLDKIETKLQENSDKIEEAVNSLDKIETKLQKMQKEVVNLLNEVQTDLVCLRDLKYDSQKEMK